LVLLTTTILSSAALWPRSPQGKLGHEIDRRRPHPVDRRGRCGRRRDLYIFALLFLFFLALSSWNGLLPTLSCCVDSQTRKNTIGCRQFAVATEGARSNLCSGVIRIANRASGLVSAHWQGALDARRCPNPMSRHMCLIGQPRSGVRHKSCSKTGQALVPLVSDARF